MAIHQNGRRRWALAIFGEQVGILAGRQIRSILTRNRVAKMPAQVPPRDRRAAPSRRSGFWLSVGIRHPAVEFGEKRSGMKRLARPGDRISSGHVFLSGREAVRVRPTYRDMTLAGRGCAHPGMTSQNVPSTTTSISFVPGRLNADDSADFRSLGSVIRIASSPSDFAMPAKSTGGSTKSMPT